LVTRDQARDIAERFLRERSPGPGWDGVGEILSPEEIEAATHPDVRALLPAKGRWQRCWTVRIRGAARGQVFIARETGQIEFAGAVQVEPGAHAG
jgi:hypothetical protein